MYVSVAGAHSFSSGESLHFNIDDHFVSFESIDKFTDIETSPGSYYSTIKVYFPPQNWSCKRYEINQDFLKRILDAEKVVLRVDLRKTYTEGVFSTDFPTTARPSFRKFYELISK